MKRMKRVLSLLLVLCMVATLAPVSGLAAENRPLVTPESDFQAQVDQVEQGLNDGVSMSGLAEALEKISRSRRSLLRSRRKKWKIPAWI